MAEILNGIVLALLAGLFQGTWALFLKYTGPWKWENFWSVYSVVALIAFPVLWTAVAVPNFVAILFSVSSVDLLVPLIFGSIWGISSVLFGLSVVRLGLSLTYSVVVGMSALIGTVSPLFINGIFPAGNVLIAFVAGLLAMLLGIILSGYSGYVKEKKFSKVQKTTSKAYLHGLLIAIAAGFMSPMLNVGFVYGNQISETAIKFGASINDATLPVWIIVLLGGFVPNIFYAVYRLFKNNTLKLFLSTKPKAALSATVAGLLWFGAFGLFGISTVLLGNLGASVGWAILMGSMIIISNGWGIFTGEWKAAKKPLAIQLASIFILIVGIVTLSSTL